MFPVSRDKKCVYCKDSMPIDSVEVYCKKLSCRMLWYKEKQDKTRKFWRQRDIELNQEKTMIVNDYCDREKINTIEVLELPYNRLKIDLVEEKQIAAFSEHLTHCMESLDDVVYEKKFHSPRVTTLTESNSNNVGGLCAMCRGACCKKRGGENHAFIQRSTLIRVLESSAIAIKNSEVTMHNSEATTESYKMAEDDPKITTESDECNTESDECNKETTEYPNVSIDNIVSMYLSYIPEKATIASCVYHGVQGCTLPEKLRADICSEFFCSTLSEHINKHVEHGSPESTLVFAVDECDIYDVAIVSDRGGKKDVPY